MKFVCFLIISVFFGSSSAFFKKPKIPKIPNPVDIAKDVGTSISQKATGVLGDIEKNINKAQKEVETMGNYVKGGEQIKKETMDVYKETITIAEKIKKGTKVGIQEMDKVVEKIRVPCREINKFVSPGVVSLVPVPQLKAVLGVTSTICQLVVEVEVPKNASDLEKYIITIQKMKF